MTAKIIIHIPHSSTLIPDSVKDEILISDHELNAELNLLTDHFIDKIFKIDSSKFATVTFPISRFIVDPERFEDDASEPMAKVGMGVIYTKTTHLKELRKPPTEEQRKYLLDKYYYTHHHQFDSLVQDALTYYGEVLIIDAHSFLNNPLPCDQDQSPDRPDICLGTDEFHTPKELIDKIMEIFQKEGFSVELNRPYSGTIVPSRHNHKNPRVKSIMIEINKDLYLEKTKDNPVTSENFQNIKNIIKRVLNSLL